MKRSTRGLPEWSGVSDRTAAAPGRNGGRGVGLGLVSLLCVGGVTPAAAQFSVTPVIVELEPVDGTATGAVRVHNDSDEPIRLRFYPGDFEQDSLGNHRFLPAGAHERSCGDRLYLFPEGAELEGGESVEAVVRLEPGGSSCWSTIFVESASRSEAGLRVVQRIAVKLFGSTSGAPAAEVRDIALVDGRLRVRVENTGESPLVASGELEIRSRAGEVVDVVEMQEFSILPGRARSIPVELPSELEPGEYLAIPIVDFGGEYLAGGQALFEKE